MYNISHSEYDKPVSMYINQYVPVSFMTISYHMDKDIIHLCMFLLPEYTYIYIHSSPRPQCYPKPVIHLIRYMYNKCICGIHFQFAVNFVQELFIPNKRRKMASDLPTVLKNLFRYLFKQHHYRSTQNKISTNNIYLIFNFQFY